MDIFYCLPDSVLAPISFSFTNLSAARGNSIKKKQKGQRNTFSLYSDFLAHIAAQDKCIALSQEGQNLPSIKKLEPVTAALTE